VPARLSWPAADAGLCCIRLPSPASGFSPARQVSPSGRGTAPAGRGGSATGWWYLTGWW